MFQKFKSFFIKTNREIPGFNDQFKKIKDIHKKKKKFRREQEQTIIQKFIEEDQISQHNQTFLAYEGFEGPVKERIKTNKKLFFVLFLFFFYLLFRIIFSALKGNINQIAYGSDFRTDSCGYGKLALKPFLYYILPNIDLTLKMCVEECPKATNLEICLYRPDGKKLHEEKRFCYTTIQSKNIGKICMPIENRTRKTLESFLNEFSNVLRRFLGQNFLYQYLIICGFFIHIFSIVLFSQIFRYKKIVFFFSFFSLILSFLSIFCFGFIFFLDEQKYVKENCYQGKVNKICDNQN